MKESQPNFITDNENLELLKQSILGATKREEDKVKKNKN